MTCFRSLASRTVALQMAELPWRRGYSICQAVLCCQEGIRARTALGEVWGEGVGWGEPQAGRSQSETTSLALTDQLPEHYNDGSIIN